MRITCLFTVGVLASTAVGDTIIVNDFWDDTTDPVGMTWSCEDFDHSVIQDAIDEAEDGDVILICPGMYYPPNNAETETGACMMSVTEDTTLFIVGLNDLMTDLPPVVDALNYVPVIRQDIDTATLVIENLQLVNGFSPPIDVDGDGFYDYYGGGARCMAGATYLTEVQIGGFLGLAPAGCLSLDKGGGVYVASGATVSLTDCELSFNTAGSPSIFPLVGEGGGIFVETGAFFELDGGMINNNISALGGGISSSPDYFPDLDNHFTQMSPPAIFCANMATMHSNNIWGDYTDGELICIAMDCGNIGVECDCPNAGLANDCNGVQDVLDVTDRPHDPKDPYSDNEIQEAIDLLAGPTDIIRVHPGTYGPVDFQGKKVTIEALDPTPGQTIIDGGGSLQCVKTTSGETTAATLRGFTVQNGYADGFLDFGEYFMHGGEGGGVYTYRSTPVIDQCLIRNNSCQSNFPGGGGIFTGIDGTTTVMNTLLCENTPNQMMGDIIDDDSNCISIRCDDDDGNGIPDECDTFGSDTWEVPSALTPTIQDAITLAGTGDTIEIVAGEYLLDAPLKTHGKKLHLLAVDGPAATVLDGQNATTVLDCSDGETGDTIIEGFTITNGLGDIAGAVWILASSPTFINCKFINNRATQVGGAVSAGFYSEPTFNLCDFDGNLASHYGGAMHVSWRSSPTITNTTFNNNRGMFGGGAMAFEQYSLMLGYNLWLFSISQGQSTGLIENCTFTQNEVSNYGGAVFISSEASPLLENCTFQNNLADWDGGAIFVQNPNDNADPSDPAPTLLPTVTDSTFGCNAPTDINSFTHWDMYHDGGGNELDSGVCLVCPDVTDDGMVNTLDVIAVAAAWSDSCTLCPEDINGDFKVNVNDLVLLLEGWGLSCTDL